MYIAKVPNRGSPPAILLRESIRVGKKVATHTVANLSHWSAERVAAMDRCLKGEFDGVIPSDVSGSMTNGLSFGALYATRQVADLLGISSALGGSRQGKLALFMVLARIAAQGSKLSSIRWSEGQAVREVLNLEPFDEDDLYETLDWVADQQEKIEQTLFAHYCSKNGLPPSLVLYDVTSSYFEGQKNELADYGYNRDGKHGKKQIVIGLLTGPDGTPLAVRVFRGNTSDPQTVPEQVRILTKEFAIKDVIFVGDRGMVKKSGQEALSEVDFRYITALTDPQIQSYLKKDLLQMNLFDEQVQEIEIDGRRVILRRNPETCRREGHRRDDKLTRLITRIALANKRLVDHPLAKIETVQKDLEDWITLHKMQNFVKIVIEKRTVKHVIDEKAKSEDALLDGCYALISDTPAQTLSAAQIHERYLDLTQIERNFRTMKTGLLEVRPIYLRKEQRTRAHVFITMLALHAQRYMQEQLAKTYGTTDDDRYAVTVSDAIEILSKNCFVTIQRKTATYDYLLGLNDQQKTIVQSLGLEIWGNRRQSVKAVVARAKRRGRIPK